ncbi:MAG TPA: hypothetical protein VJ110_01880 [Candidatus Nanoarchaeia archaeon]|nr:hypothetical protein [Candidatus Nanoarchaeia archaeon]
MQPNEDYNPPSLSNAKAYAENLAGLLNLAETPKYAAPDEMFRIPEGYAFAVNGREIRATQDRQVIISRVVSSQLHKAFCNYGLLCQKFEELNDAPSSIEYLESLV